MDYSLDKLTTVEELDALLITVTKEKEELERRRRNLGESITNFDERTDNLSEEQVALTTLLDAYTAAFNALPEGARKSKMEADVHDVEKQLAVLDKQQYTYNAIALLGKQSDYNRYDQQVPALEAYITAIEARKTELGG